MSSFHDVSLLSYDPHGISLEGFPVGAWKETVPSLEFPNTSSSALSLLTWNVQSREGHYESQSHERFQSIVIDIAKLNSDVVALQNVTPHLANLLKQDNAIRANWAMTDFEQS